MGFYSFPWQVITQLYTRLCKISVSYPCSQSANESSLFQREARAGRARASFFWLFLLQRSKERFVFPGAAFPSLVPQSDAQSRVEIRFSHTSEVAIILDAVLRSNDLLQILRPIRKELRGQMPSLEPSWAGKKKCVAIKIRRAHDSGRRAHTPPHVSRL